MQDHLLEEKLQQPIAEIFAERGEKWFRAEECQHVLQLIADQATVLATGGGAVLHEEVREALRSRPTIWLRAPMDLMVERVARSHRPRLMPDVPDLRSEIEAIFQARQAFYAEVANYSIDTSTQSIDGIVAALATYWQGLNKEESTQ